METVTLLTASTPNKRRDLGLKHLTQQLQTLGYSVVVTVLPTDFIHYRQISGRKIYLGVRSQDEFITWLEENELLLYQTPAPEKAESFYLETLPAELTVIAGGDDTGLLYGALEYTKRLKDSGRYVDEITFGDAPVFKLRGPVVGLQKTKVEPPRLTYEYPIIKERFPWFYDRLLWEKFLDELLAMRCNVLYIWSGHPFSSLVKVPDYPEALEVSEEQFTMNRQLFTWLTKECDRRGIWVVLKFYNIHIPLPFAEKHGLELLQSNIHPLVADYTRKTIIEFIKSFPNIGLMVCLGEALRGNENKTNWFVETIIPAINTALQEAKIMVEPPLILRGHDCDPVDAIEKAMPHYQNLYTMWKYNGESLTTYYPRGQWQEIHHSLANLGSTHIMNVHVLANLEPFQFNAPLYIQKCVEAGYYRLGCNSLHLYPLFYWDWPYTPDKTTPRLLQMDRDQLWFQAWFRYAWNPFRDETTEKEHWANVFATRYQQTKTAGQLILEAEEELAQCAPKLLGRVGITEGNRQTFSLGMTMAQLTAAASFRPNLELWHSVARKGEQLQEFVAKEVAGQPHLGETPLDCVAEVRRHYQLALKKLQQVVTPKLQPEFQRIYTDALALAKICEFYALRIEAAVDILTYQATLKPETVGQVDLLVAAEKKMANSVSLYQELVTLTQETYLYANSMQTRQRKIPFPDGEAFDHWQACLPQYQQELANFQKNVTQLQLGQPHRTSQVTAPQVLQPVDFAILNPADCETFAITKGTSAFTDIHYPLNSITPELQNLTGIRFSLQGAQAKGATLKLHFAEDAYVLVGYFENKEGKWLQVPDLETNTHADDRGGLAVVYPHGLGTANGPVLNVHALQYEKGNHEIFLGTGGYVIVGVVSQQEKLRPRKKQYTNGAPASTAWLYEEE